MRLSTKICLLGFVMAFFVLSSCGGGGGTSGGGGGGGGAVLTSEGSASAPKDLGVTEVAYTAGSVAYGGISYYQFTTTRSGSYVVSLTNTTVKMEWDLFVQKSDLSNGLATPLASKDDIFTSPGDLAAVAANLDANKTYYLRVTDWDTVGGTYHISIVNGSSEGSKLDPTTLIADGVGHSGGIDANGYSYYSFTTTGGSVNISVSGLSVPADTLTWTLYSDAGFTTAITGLSCNTDTFVAGPIDCAADNLAAGTYYLRVSNSYNYTPQDTAYTITLTPDAVAYYATPALLQLDTHVTATVLENELNHYYINLPTPGTYTFTINTLQNIAWDLYSDPGYTTLVKHCDYETASMYQTQCSSGNIAHGIYYLRLTNNYSGPIFYDLVATQGGSEGAIGDPIQLTSRATYTSGKVSAYGTSYYSFQTEALSQSVPYLIALSSPGSWVYWTFYSDAAFTTQITSCWSTNWNNDVVCSTKEPNGSAPLLPGTTYYFAVSNANTPGQTYSAKVSPLSSSAGCAAGGTCYTFEGGTMSPFTSAWSAVTGTSGSGTYSARSGMAHNNDQSVCFSLGNLTDVKYVAFSLSTNLGGATDALRFYVDGYPDQVGPDWTAANPWQRVVMRAPFSGTHYYQWCHEKSIFANFTDNNAWVDDVEFVY